MVRQLFATLILLVGTDAYGDCSHDRSALLQMNLNDFDQDMNGGWRQIAKNEGCQEAAADLIADYRKHNQPENKTLIWHEGQLRAQAGDTEKAIQLFGLSKKPVEEDQIGWNHYVDASIAFLKKDKASLTRSRELLSETPKPSGLKMVDAKGKPVEMPWPPNLFVVDRFIKCFDMSYQEAYESCQ